MLSLWPFSASQAPTDFQGNVVLTINNVTYTVDSTVPAGTSLNSYIRDYAELTATKSMCYEGGCGSCTVAVTIRNPATGVTHTQAINSCLVHIFSCHGWAVTTDEGLGNRRDGYHTIQSTLAQYSGTQCGFCSPGFVMNMYSLYQERGTALTMSEVENSFGGNICRCTGYRSIMDAFKSLATDATPHMKKNVKDIEEVYKTTCCPKKAIKGQKNCCGVDLEAMNYEKQESLMRQSLHLKLGASDWYRVTTISQIYEVFNFIGSSTYMLVAGNTGYGVYRAIRNGQVSIDVSGVVELKTISTTSGLSLGGGVTFTEAIHAFNTISSQTGYSYATKMAEYFDKIGNVQMRNGGTLAGNLILKHVYNGFPSDLFVMLETVGATLTIVSESQTTSSVTLQDFLNLDMNKSVIRSIEFPQLDSTYVLKLYKIMPRAQNTHAQMNAGFLFKLSTGDNGMVTQKPTIVYGAIAADFIHATKTEDYLNGKVIYDEKVMKEAIRILDTELHPVAEPLEASPEYKKGLAKALLYKFFLSQASNRVNSFYRSGGEDLTRPLSTGIQTYQTDRSLWPLNQPIPKIEAAYQTAGEVKYVNDTPTFQKELFGAFVVTTVGQGTISRIDASAALMAKPSPFSVSAHGENVSGVVRFVTAEDIPGVNTFQPLGGQYNSVYEELFCSGKVAYCGQAVGMVLAETNAAAFSGAAQVVVEYTDVTTPVVHVRDAINKNDKSRIKVAKILTAKKQLSEVDHVVKGSFDMSTVYHYYLETQQALVIPMDDGFDVICATQEIDNLMVAAAAATGLHEDNSPFVNVNCRYAYNEKINEVNREFNVTVRRIGGAFGGKGSRAAFPAVAGIVGAYLTNRPVRVVLPMETNMAIIGKKGECAFDYEAGVNSDGKIQYLKMDTYNNEGFIMNDAVAMIVPMVIPSCYDSSTWSVVSRSVLTDTASNTYMRSPGNFEGIAAIEGLMDHIAKAVNKDPVDVRAQNYADGSREAITEMVTEIRTSSDYEARRAQVQEFNRANRWKKRGIALINMTWPWLAQGRFTCVVSIYAQDGSVSVSHGGIEMGQGVNTKVAQVVAYTLGIPLDYVSIKPTDGFIGANCSASGGSTVSDSCCYAALQCCNTLNERLRPYRTNSSQTWRELVLTAYNSSVDLSTLQTCIGAVDRHNYNIYGVAVCEVELDVLTGERQILRVDINEDLGRSISPEVDIGQVEGAFVIASGVWLSEEIIFDSTTGQVLTDRSWNYRPPGVKDIPIDFRVELRRNSTNPLGVLSSKAVGEPPMCLGYSAYLALKKAIAAARVDSGAQDEWFKINSPINTERAFLATLTTSDQFSY